VWVIRAGEDGSRVDEVVDAGVVALEYPDVPDGRSVDLYDITERLKARGWTSPETRAELFSHFVNQVRTGDLVVLPDTARRDVVIGRVDGDYEFAFGLDAEELRHRRAVTWLGRHGVDQLPEAHRDVTKQRAVLAERSGQSLLDHLESVERGEVGRSATDTTVTRAPRSPRSSTVASRSSTPRAPKPAPAVTRTCTECFLAKSVDLFDGGSDVCVDCA
jgi:hypothetical protein